MKRYAITLLCCASLMACGSDTGSGDNTARPIGGGGGLGTIPTPPEEPPADDDENGEDEVVVIDDFVRVGGDVTSMIYDPETEILTIQGDPFDFVGDFARSPDDDVDGFAAFRSLTGVDRSEREYLAYLGMDTDNGLAIGVVGTPYRLRSEFGGTMLAREAVPELPSNVQMTHDGHYAAVRTLVNLEHRIEGRAELFLDFFDDRNPGIEGRIYDRRNLDLVTNQELDEITLVFTDIDERGNFRGEVTDEDRNKIRGEYDGMIAGDGAAASAGVIVITDNSLLTDETTLDGIDLSRITEPVHIERGAFIARRAD